MKSTCTVDGCDRFLRARGYCGTHLYRFDKYGDPGPAEIRTWKKAPSACTVEDCEGKPKANGLCSTHWSRWHKTGDPGTAELQRQRNRRCSIDGCDESHKGYGYCLKHLRRWRNNGDPFIRGNGNYRGDDVGYMGVHHRLRQERGRASSLYCMHCGHKAMEWAFDYRIASTEETRFNGKGMPYATDLRLYIPLCTSCHKIFDLGYSPIL